LSTTKPDPSQTAQFPQTAVVQPSLDIPPGFRACAPATHRGSTVLFNNLQEMRAYGKAESPYWRYGLHGTPTSEALCQQLAHIEGGSHALLLPSGLGAISLVYFGLLKTGDDVLVPDNAYGPTCDHGAWLARDFGITMRRYDPMVGAGIVE
jgi:cystathionine beta-lyase